ncbi:MAG: hypothetical protein FWF67_03110 [Fibromonadales bacterium]|nr:hypothetical protein [Fibromonadales bacterium]
MRKFLFLLFPALATLAIFSCSADDDMPCLSCREPYPPQDQQPYPQYPPQNQYAYCLIYNSYYGYYTCEYMSVANCGSGMVYSDESCGSYWWLE